MSKEFNPDNFVETFKEMAMKLTTMGITGTLGVDLRKSNFDELNTRLYGSADRSTLFLEFGSIILRVWGDK